MQTTEVVRMIALASIKDEKIKELMQKAYDKLDRKQLQFKL